MKKSALIAALLASLPLASHAGITFLSGVSTPGGGEVVSFDPNTNRLLSTTSLAGINHQIDAYSLLANGTLTPATPTFLNSVFGAANTSSISSVYSDSRGFGVATVIPTAKGASDFGRLAFFDPSTGTVFHTVDLGYHPDHVSSTPDGTKLLIANEGEYGSTDSAVPEAVNRAGSVTVVDLSSVTSGNFLTQIPSLGATNVATYEFTAPNLAVGVTIDGTRNNRLDTLSVKTADAADIEPEFITATNDKAFITLQENNAIATLNLTGPDVGKYTAINNLGTITTVIDASDRDPQNGGTTAININDTVAGLPMPDTIVSFSKGGVTYLATANEGDNRVDDADRVRGASAGIDTTDGGLGDVFYSGSLSSSAGIGRLYLSNIDGNVDGDGAIDVPTTIGTRSFSIYNSANGTRVFDSGSMIEEYSRLNDPTTFNLDVEDDSISQIDKRSDNKGPEPEALAFGSIDGRDFIFLGAERQNGIYQFDVTDFSNISIVGYFNTFTSGLDSGGDFISPETIRFIAASDNITGQNLLIVGYEGAPDAFQNQIADAYEGSIAVYAVTIPEPTTFLLIGLGSSFLLLNSRRRRDS